jgi:hypothetical protein
MGIVVVAGLALGLGAARREQRRRDAELQYATAAHRAARVTREVAELALAEYEHGIARQERHAAEAEIARAELDVMSAEQSGYAPTIARARTAVEQAHQRLAALEKKSSESIKELGHEVQKARAEEAARQEALERTTALSKQWW